MRANKGGRGWIIGSVVLVAVLIGLLVLTACDGGNGGNGTPRPWVVHYGESRTDNMGWIGMDPQTIGIVVVALQTAEILFLSDPVTRAPTPNLATGLEYSLNGSVVDIFLRDDVKFHNGDNMTAEDVKFSYDRMHDPAIVEPGWASYYNRFIDHVEVINDYQVRIYRTEEQLSPREDFALQPVIVPKNYIEEVGWETWGENPVLTGPMKIVDWEQDDYVHYEKAFPEEGHWLWGDLPNYDELIIHSIIEPSSRLAGLTTGLLDVAVIPPANVPDVQSDPDLTMAMSEWCYSWDIIFYDWANNASPLSDPDVRRAVSLAIDREGIADNVLQGLYEPKGSYWAPYSFGYRYREPDPHDPVEAQNLLTAAGYPEGFSTYFPWPQGQEDLAALAIISSLAGVGITAEAQPLESGTWGAKCALDQHVGMGYMWMPGWGGQYYPESVFGLEVSSYAAAVSRYIPEVEAAYDLFFSVETEEQYREAAWAAEELVYDELGYKIPVWAVHTAWALRPTIGAWVPYPGSIDQILVGLTYAG